VFANQPQPALTQLVIQGIAGFVEQSAVQVMRLDHTRWGTLSVSMLANSRIGI